MKKRLIIVLFILMALSIFSLNYVSSDNSIFGWTTAPIDNGFQSIPQPAVKATCIDIDGGMAYYDPGYAVLSSSSNTRVHDSCVYDPNAGVYIVHETYCENNQIKIQSYQCQNGCKEGGSACATSVSDTTKPVVTLVFPINYETFTTNSPVEFKCQVSDNIALSKVEFWVTSETGGFQIDQIKELSGNAETVTFSKTFAQENSNAWNCKAIDESGNYAYGNINGLSPGFSIIQSVFDVYYLNMQNSIQLYGKQVSLAEVKSNGDIIIAVDGNQELINLGDTKIISDLGITNLEAFYSQDVLQRSARIKIVQVSGGEILIGDNPIIRSIGGHARLYVGEKGKWFLNVYDPNKKYVTYAVDFRDGSVLTSPGPKLESAEWTFEHTYRYASKYEILFTVVNQDGAVTTSTMNVEVLQVPQPPRPMPAETFEVVSIKDLLNRLFG